MITEPAHYRCLRVYSDGTECGHEWYEVPSCGDPKEVTHPVCPKCGHNYLKWVDFEGWRQRNPLKK